MCMEGLGVLGLYFFLWLFYWEVGVFLGDIRSREIEGVLERSWFLEFVGRFFYWVEGSGECFVYS